MRNKTILVRNIIFSEIEFKGFYNYKDSFQFFNIDKPEKTPLFAHNPVCLELKLDFDPVEFGKLYKEDDSDSEGKKRFKESFYNSYKLNEIRVLLSVFTNYPFYNYDNRHYWFSPSTEILKKLTEIGVNQVSFWGQTYFAPSNKDFKFGGENFTTLTEHEELKSESSIEYFNKYFARRKTDGFTLPDSLDSLFDKYFSLDLDIRLRFLRSVVLFNDAVYLKDYSNRSIALVSLVSSIENFLDKKTKKCKCGQSDLYSISAKFKDFVEEYSGGNKDLRKFINQLYNKRSKIVHETQLFASDYVIGSDDFTESSVKFEQYIMLVRICLVNWLAKQGAQTGKQHIKTNGNSEK
jgi:hypothetical protein